MDSTVYCCVWYAGEGCGCLPVGMAFQVATSSVAHDVRAHFCPRRRRNSHGNGRHETKNGRGGACC